MRLPQPCRWIACLAIKQLPTIPKLLHEADAEFQRRNARIDEIAAKIAMDQVISVKGTADGQLRRPAPWQ